mgnify:CR=1 FL=1
MWPGADTPDRGSAENPMGRTQRSANEIDGTNRAIDQTWIGPIPEVDRYGQRTGTAYLRCKMCSAEVLVQDREYAAHYEGCPAQ